MVRAYLPQSFHGEIIANTIYPPQSSGLTGETPSLTGFMLFTDDNGQMQFTDDSGNMEYTGA